MYRVICIRYCFDFEAVFFWTNNSDFLSSKYCLVSAVRPNYYLDIENSKTISLEILKILEINHASKNVGFLGFQNAISNKLFFIKTILGFLLPVIGRQGFKTFDESLFKKIVKKLLIPNHLRKLGLYCAIKRTKIGFWARLN